MNIVLIATGAKMPNWVNTGFGEYQSRFPKNISLNLIEIPLQKRTDKRQLPAAMQKEATLILEQIPQNARVITLDMAGKTYSSEELAMRLSTWQTYRDIALIIGGPEGLHPSVKARANESWALGRLTLPHPLVRIVVAEALYRAWSISQNHPYHRA